jgi:hypothetical protein
VLPLAACADQLVDPRPEPLVPVPPRSSFSFVPPVSGIVAAPDFAIPGSNTVNSGATTWFDIGYTVEEPGWVEMRTAGEVEWKVNPAGYTTGCGNWCVGSDVLPFYGEGTAGGAGLPAGELRSYLAAHATRPDWEGSGAGQRTSPDGQVYALVPVQPGTRLWAARSGMNGVRSCAGSGSCGDLSEGPTGWYLFESRMKVQVRKVIPVQVQPNKTSYEPGEALIWKAVVYEGVGQLTWAFVSPGDIPLEVPCAGQTECVWEPPPYPGRMRVTGRWRGGHSTFDVVGFSDSVTNQPAKLKLTCTSKLRENRVTRGDTINCTAGTDPAGAPGELKITGWSFRGIARNDGDTKSTEWNGVVAKEGEVVVQGTIGTGNSTRAAQTLRVIPRTWPVMQFTQPPKVTVGLGPQNMFAYPASGAFGNFVLVSDEFAQYFSELPVQTITSGPNTGWSFLPSPVQLMRPVIYLHPALYPPSRTFTMGTPIYFPWNFWYDDQNGKGSGTCKQSDVSNFLKLAERHEGVTMQPNSHYGKANDAFRSTKLHEKFEELSLAGDAEAFRSEATKRWNQFQYGTHKNVQANFDAVDTPLVHAQLGCTLDGNPKDP